MKFICVECDEPMKFDSTPGLDDDGSLPVTFRCPSCDWGVTLLTNPQETQMVRSLGIKVGGAEVAPPPMEMMQTFLAKGHGSVKTGGSPADGESAGKCPFSAIVKQMSDEDGDSQT